MKYLLFIFMAFANLASANPDSLIVEAPKFSLGKKVTLEAGTLILLETDVAINSNNLNEEQLLKFKVTQDVHVKSRVVIAKDAIAIGKVKTIQATSFNDPECITIEVTNVQTVDGQMIELSGFEQCLRGNFPGESVKVEEGTSIVAVNKTDTVIRWK